MAEELNRNRIENLNTMLVRERNKALAQVREYRRDQAEDATALPMDELDWARTLAEVETHASLIEQVENRIKQIDTAFSQLEQGGYGVCEECGSETPLARLEVCPLPRVASDFRKLKAARGAARAA